MPLEDLKMQMKLWFSSCTVQFCRREANSAARTIATLPYACNVDEALLWEDDVPAEAAVIVMGEMPNMSS